VGALIGLDWLLAASIARSIPYTSASPGGWGWSDLSGAVPDVDDTAGALLALGVLQAIASDARHGRSTRLCSWAFSGS